MSDVDYYDVQSMIRDADARMRGEIEREVQRLREQMQDEIRDLREQIDSLDRVLNSRTEHLV